MSHPVLTRFDVRILRDKSATDLAQVPASGATIMFYRQGATSQQYVEIRTFEERIPVDVYYTGTLIVGDTVQVDGAGAQLTVDDLVSNTRVLLSNYNGPDAFVGAGARLVSILDRPSVFSDPLGTIGGSTQLNADTTGRAVGYVATQRFDYIVSGGGLTGSLVYMDAIGGTSPSPSWVNARDYPSIQTAIDALPPSGGVVYVPAGTYVITATLVIPKNKAVHLLGEGCGSSADPLTVISCSNPAIDMLHIKGSYSTIENLTIKGPKAIGSGRGVVIGLVGASEADVMRRISILGCRIMDTASSGLYFLDFDDPNGIPGKTLTIWVHCERTEIRNNYTSDAIRIGRDCNAHLYASCAVDGFRDQAVNAISASGLTFLACVFEDRLGPVPATGDFPYAVFDGCNNVGLLGCWFESHIPPSPEPSNDKHHYFVSVGPTIDCNDVRVSGCRFARADGNLPRLVRVGSNSKAVLVENPTCAMAVNPLGTRYSGPDDQKDIYILGESEVTTAGGLVKSNAPDPDLNARALAISGASGLSIIGVGPRVGAPSVTEAARNSLQSLARDKKPGDRIFNTTKLRQQHWDGTEWIPFEKEVSGTGAFSGSLYPGALGMVRVSCYLQTGAPGPVTVKLRWSPEGLTEVEKVIATVGTVTSEQNGFDGGQLVARCNGPGAPIEGLAFVVEDINSSIWNIQFRVEPL